MTPFHRTKIVATLGPVSRSEAVITELIRRGADVFRLNFAHASHEAHAATIRMVRHVSKRLGAPVGILQDLPGPKLRLGKLPVPSIELKRDDVVELAPAPSSKSPDTLPIDYPLLKRELKSGNTVFIADGLIRLRVEPVKGDVVRARVENGGVVRSGNGVNMPDSNLSLKAFTSADRRHLRFGMEQGVDFVGVSFVGTREDLDQIRATAKRWGYNPFLVAKIERGQAIRNLESIAEEADAVMVARGDLGVEVPFSEIPGLQTKIVSMAHRKGRPVIVATQVLESMIQNPRPTRAEATDVAMAVLEGADAVMLSGETAVGKYPVKAVQALADILTSVEKIDYPRGRDTARSGAGLLDVLAEETSHVAERTGAKAIVIPMDSVETAARLSHFRPRLPIVAFCSNEPMRRRLSLVWGVTTLPSPSKFSPHNANHVLRQLQRAHLAKRGDLVLLLSSSAGSNSKHTGQLTLLPLV